MRDWLVDARKKLGMTQCDVSAAVGIKQPTYYGYEADQYTPAPKIAKRIADVLGVPWTKFYESEK